MPDIVVLEIVYDNSDIQTDYFDNDRTLDKWVICPLQGKITTEGKLRAALAQLPEWLQSLGWNYQKGEKYSMSNHPYGQLRSATWADLPGWKHTTYKVSTEGSGLGFIIQPDWLEHIGTYDKDAQVPQTLEAMRARVEYLDAEENRKNHEREVYMNSPEWKIRRLKGKIAEAQRVTAIMGASGFRFVTDEERAASVAELEKELAELEATQ